MWAGRGERRESKFEFRGGRERKREELLLFLIFCGGTSYTAPMPCKIKLVGFVEGVEEEGGGFCLLLLSAWYRGAIFMTKMLLFCCFFVYVRRKNVLQAESACHYAETYLRETLWGFCRIFFVRFVCAFFFVFCAIGGGLYLATFYPGRALYSYSALGCGLYSSSRVAIN